MNTTIVEISNLTKLFFPPLPFSHIVTLRLRRIPPVKALDNVSLSIKKGKIIGILGPNGAGKTTLLKIISTLILPDKGKVTVKGFPVGKNDEKIKSLIGLVSPQERSFYWRLTGLQNLEFFAALYGLSKKETKSRVNQLFKLFNIDYGTKRLDSYSSGMKRKFSLVRALLHNPDILLLDEPIKSLDYNSTYELKQCLLDRKSEGKTIILATHNISEIQGLCDIFIIMNKGKLRGIGTLGELKEKTKTVSSLSDIYLKLTKNV